MKLDRVERSKDGWTARKMNGGLEPIHIVARDGTTIIATVHQDEGYEDDASLMARAPEMYRVLRMLCDVAMVEFNPDKFVAPPAFAPAIRAAMLIVGRPRP